MNVCAGPFGASYDFYIERPWLMGLIGRAIWGIDASVPTAPSDFAEWLTSAGLGEPQIEPQLGFAAFSARKGAA